MGDARGQVLNLGLGEVKAAGLAQAYEGVYFLRVGEQGEPVRMVFGVPMTSGKSPRAAAEAWLGEWVDVFGVQGVELELFNELVLTDRDEWKVSKGVARFTQSIAGIRVEGAQVVVTAVKDKNDPNAAWRVFSAQGLVAAAPALGVTPAKAKQQATAAASAAKPELGPWSEPELTIIQNRLGDVREGTRLAWATVGAHPSQFEKAERVWVDAHSGAFIKSAPALSFYRAPDEKRRANGDERPPTISGTVTAWRTPDWWSDTRVPGWSACEEVPVEQDQAGVLVEVFDGGGVLRGSAFTYSDGTYSIVPTGSGPYTVRATLGGANWFVAYPDMWSPFFDPVLPCTDENPIFSVHLEETGVSTGSTVDFVFNDDPSPVDETAYANSMEGIRITQTYWTDVLGSSAMDDDFLVLVVPNSNAGYMFPKGYLAPGFGGQEWACDDTVVLSWITANPSWGQQTVAVHEHGHLFSLRIQGFDVFADDTAGFREGFADACAFTILPDAVGPEQPTVMCPHCQACDAHNRDPLAYDPEYPDCSSSQYDRGMLLGAIWIELRQALGYSYTKTLFGAWAPTAEPPGESDTICDGLDQSADENTYIEVLIADDNDGDLSNGTPNKSEICAVFFARGVTSELCEEAVSGPRGRVPDCDRDGSVTLFDVLCFQNALLRGESWTDLDGDGAATGNDMRLFLSMLP